MKVQLYDRVWSGSTYTEQNRRTYSNLRSLSFNPETDLTLSTLPVCEFSLEIVTEDSIAVGRYIKLLDDVDVRYANYRVGEAEWSETVNGETVWKVKAQSELALLDTWTLKACRVGSRYMDYVLAQMFNVSSVKSGTPKKIWYNGDYSNIIVDGFFPEQTARERLQQLCLAYGLTVHQWFCDGIYLQKSTPNGGFIPFENTFWKPERHDADSAGMVLISSFDGWTQTEPDPSQLPSGEEVVEVHDDVNDQTWWGIKSDNSLQISNPDNPDGPLVTISDIMIINENNAQAVQNDLMPRYFAENEWTLDVINNGQYYPGMEVTFVGTIDPDAILAPFRAGMIKSCDFTFGVQNRSRITVVGDSITDIGGHVIVHYIHTYEDAEGTEHTLSLGCNRYYSPPGTSITIKHPPVYVDVVGETRIFQPSVAQSTVTLDDSPDKELTIEYELEVS